VAVQLNAQKGAAYPEVRISEEGLALRVCVTLENRSGSTWRSDSFALGCQFFDPETNLFLMEGPWTAIPRDLPAGQATPMEIDVSLPPESGAYRIYISAMHQPDGWAYASGEPFLMIDAAVAEGRTRVLKHEISTMRALRFRNFRRNLPKLLMLPVQSIVRNRRLIRSMVRRDILARYRGSVGDVFWTVLNPLLLMITYFFVFGLVLQTRFGPDNSPTGFALYFLAGMLPWLAFSEPVGRSPYSIPEHRNFVKKLIFPLETIPVNYVVAGLVTECFAMAVFIAALLVIRGRIPITVVWLPLLLIPQLLFTLGLCWFLSALGAFVRDLGQIMGFVLTLWFFITPICYPEATLSKLPAPMLSLLNKNPMLIFVRAYRGMFLDGRAPGLRAIAILWIVSIIVFLLGHAWFHKLRKSFADFI
jgi:lipopolysaccharide transport system permease protein